MATKWQRVRVNLPEQLTPDQQAAAADLIVERIVERTNQGKDKNGRPFAKYSEAYKHSLDFKIAGKSDHVDLQLSGDMLAALAPLKSTKKWIEVGFERDSEENAKADGNIRGTYGKDTPNPKKARDFLGITEKELMKIIKYVKSQE